MGIIIALILNNGDPFAPVPLSFEMFFISAFIALLNQNKWGVKLSYITVVIIIIGLLCFSISAMIVNYLMIKIKKNEVKKNVGRPIIVSTFTVVLVTIYSIIITGIVLKKTMEIANSISGNINISNMMHLVRNAYIFQDASLGLIPSILGFSVTGLGYVFTYIIIYNFIFWGGKYVKKVYYIPCLIYLIEGALSSGRTYLIKWIVTIVTLIVILIYKKYNIKVLKVGKIIKIMIYGILAIVIFFIVFQILGIFTQKTGKLNTWDMLSIYLGSSIPALDYSIINYIPGERFFGEESFYGLYGLLNHLGMDIPNDILHLPFIYFENGYSSNVYTSLRTYIYDFGFIGMCFVQILLGIFFSIYYNLIKRFNLNYIWILIYGMFNYGLAMQGIEDTFMRSFMSLTQIFSIVFIIIFYKLFVEQKIKIRWRK